MHIYLRPNDFTNYKNIDYIISRFFLLSWNIRLISENDYSLRIRIIN